MREILFKAKRLSDGAWVEGYYIGPIGVLDVHEICDVHDITGPRVEVDPSTVCQYTGLTDKNGKKIFEGDIIHWTNWKGEQKEAPVCYDPEWNRFCVWLNGAESMGVNKHLSTSGIEIIGNIYDGEGGRHERSPEVRMKCNKDCIANVCGECAVEKCEGQIQRLGIRNNNAETAAWTYKIAVDSFKDYFGKKDADQ